MCVEGRRLTVVAVIVYQDDFFHQVGGALLQDAAARGSGVKVGSLAQKLYVAHFKRVVTLSRAKTVKAVPSALQCCALVCGVLSNVTQPGRSGR